MVQSSSPLDEQLLVQLNKLHRPKGERGGGEKKERKKKERRKKKKEKKGRGKNLRLGTFPNVASFLSTAGLA